MVARYLSQAVSWRRHSIVSVRISNPEHRGEHSA